MKFLKSIALALLVLLCFSCENEVLEIDDSSINSNSDILGKSSKPKGNSNGSFLVISQTNKLPKNLKTDLAAANGKITSSLSEIGIAVVKSSDADFIAKSSKIKGVQSVVPNLTINWLDPNERKEAIDANFGNPPASGDDDFFFDLQWGHDAVDAPEAWEAGYRGAGVRVAVLDSGFDLTHPDLEPNINFELSKDFTGEGLQYLIDDSFSHGTHTAGTIGAADNAYGTIGVAPEAELVLVKVLSDAGSGSLGAILGGIYHAAMNDVDVINMSIGTTLSRRGGVYDSEGNLLGYATAEDIAEYINVYNRAITFAYQNGTTVITSAGNAATDYDHSADLIHMPSGARHALSISATAPRGWGANPSNNLDELASYSNYGQSVIDFAAPGGDFLYAFEPGGFDVCTVGPLENVCFIFDYVFSTGSNGNWYWSVGTSMASPHAAGVAAIIIGKNGGDMKPAQVEAALKASSDDLGKPGKDDFYGSGRVNAYNAVSD
ncbi:S8 family serine peptidase [uncultured Algibacter sp.]|uniref:S8 family peptidase n=1 Tax=uncultured Algibacter sp. TaxID=298659 RepID=UPI002610C986|nr:S8 family serine peptidase [uncultured Algibacter sp.]